MPTHIRNDSRSRIAFRTLSSAFCRLALAVCAVAAGSVCSTGRGAEIDFAHEVAPLLKTHCAKCHGGTQKKGGFSLNDRAALLAGGESGAAVVAGKSRQSELWQRVVAEDETLRMPPEGTPLSAAQAALLARWIDEGAKWESGFTFGPRLYEPPLKPRVPTLPPPHGDRIHPIDRLLDAELARQGRPPLEPLDDAAFLRRASLDLIGLLPTPDERAAFLRDPAPDKRERLARALLARDVDYAEHWLSFWNDLLRNDYTGAGFITGGRKQITKWLYDALVNNKPYDQFARELIAPPTPDSAGFGEGIRWRGEVSAGQTVEIQFAQSLGQAFLGVNLKCASCHDSFVDRWTLDDAYGLAAIYSKRPLELHRCDKPTGKMARPAWLFPELGQVDPAASQPERLKQLAALLTHRENGRFTRAIVNRLWHRLMGRGLVHPTDAMQTEPWNADLLDHLAEHLAENHFDLKRTLEHIATSRAYQSLAERVDGEADARGYRYAGPRAKRMTAEQFVDAVWQVTDAGPQKIDAPVARGKTDPRGARGAPVSGVWIWSRADAGAAAAGETIALRRQWELSAAPVQAMAVIACDNAHTLYVNGQRVAAGENWETPDVVPLTNLKAGANEILVVAVNGGAGPNPAGLFFEARGVDAAGRPITLASDEHWRWSDKLPDKNGRYARAPDDWRPAAKAQSQQTWMSRLEGALASALARGADDSSRPARSSLLKSDFLTRALGRPIRDQIVSARPSELSTLEAIDLSNGEILASALRQGAARLRGRGWKSPDEFVEWLFQFALGRDPSADERQALVESLGADMPPHALEDALWAVFMLPEFQTAR